MRQSLYEASSKEREQHLADTRRQMSQLQEKLHVSEQVTAATQQRALREDKNICEQLMVENREDHVYEHLLKDFNQLGCRRGMRTLLSVNVQNRSLCDI